MHTPLGAKHSGMKPAQHSLDSHLEPPIPTQLMSPLKRVGVDPCCPSRSPPSIQYHQPLPRNLLESDDVGVLQLSQVLDVSLLQVSYLLHSHLLPMEAPQEDSTLGP